MGRVFRRAGYISFRCSPCHFGNPQATFSSRVVSITAREHDFPAPDATCITLYVNIIEARAYSLPYSYETEHAPPTIFNFLAVYGRGRLHGFTADFGGYRSGVQLHNIVGADELHSLPIF